MFAGSRRSVTAYAQVELESSRRSGGPARSDRHALDGPSSRWVRPRAEAALQIGPLDIQPDELYAYMMHRLLQANLNSDSAMVAEATDAGALMEGYEAMALASKAMLVAAREGDWNTVASVERHCARIIGEFPESAVSSLDEAQRRRRLEIIQALLAEDAEIRHLAQPWLAQVHSVLAPARRSAA